MKSGHRSCAGRLGPVIDKSAIAFRNEEDTFNVPFGVPRKMILEITDYRSGWKISNP